MWVLFKVRLTQKAIKIQISLSEDDILREGLGEGAQI